MISHSFWPSTHTPLVEGFHCQVSSEGWDGIHPSYENLDLKGMVRSSKVVNPTLVQYETKNSSKLSFN